MSEAEIPQTHIRLNDSLVVADTLDEHQLELDTRLDFLVFEDALQPPPPLECRIGCCIRNTDTRRRPCKWSKYAYGILCGALERTIEDGYVVCIAAERGAHFFTSDASDISAGLLGCNRSIDVRRGE
jgi:hypothetical protein